MLQVIKETIFTRITVAIAFVKRYSCKFEKKRRYFLEHDISALLRQFENLNFSKFLEFPLC